MNFFNIGTNLDLEIFSVFNGIKVLKGEEASSLLTSSVKLFLEVFSVSVFGLS